MFSSMIVPSTFDTLAPSLICPTFEAFLFAPAAGQQELAQCEYMTASLYIDQRCTVSGLGWSS
jgi:hypothetical protein